MPGKKHLNLLVVELVKRAKQALDVTNQCSRHKHKLQDQDHLLSFQQHTRCTKEYPQLESCHILYLFEHSNEIKKPKIKIKNSMFDM